MMTTKEKGRRSREEERHGGCAATRGRPSAQHLKRSGRKNPRQACISSVRFPARVLAFERRDWLQRQDLNLRHRGYEPRGMTTSPRCVENVRGQASNGLQIVISVRPWDIVRPARLLWPVGREPLHCALKTNSAYVSPLTDLLKALAPRENLRRDARFRSASEAAVAVSECDQLFS